MKKLTVNILCSTGITLIVLAAIAAIFGARFLLISSVFQSLIANMIIHIGLLFTRRFESDYAILEYTLDIGYTTAIVLISGFVFNWYSSTPIGILITMSVVIYCIGILLNTIRIRQDICEINELIKRRNSISMSKETLK